MHAIEFVDELPPENDFLLLAIPDGALVFYRRCAVTPQTLEDSWAAYRSLIGADGRPGPDGRQADLTLVSFG